MKLLLIIATIVAIVTSLPIIEEKLDTLDIDSEYRLDGNAIPSHYDLEITPHFFNPLEPFTFHGKVVIHLETIAILDVLRINAKYLEIADITIVNSDETSSILAEHNLDSVTEILTIEFSENLIIGEKYKLTIHYEGEMRDDNRGFYRSSYTEANGETEWLGSTQLQVTHARRVFPGFDEPQYKATISLTIKDIPIEYDAISNTVVADVTKDTSTKTIKFSKTPKMSTYLLAFVVSKFQSFSSDLSILNVFGRPSNVASLESAHKVGDQILHALEEYLDIKYTEMLDGEGNPLQKLDMVAVPDMGGAMENWGLLTYQELYLLYDKYSTTVSRVQRTAGIIAHEQTHLWFGDLVTCQWWDNAWLNEGFAQYFQYHIIPMINENWEMDKQFVVEQLQSALLFDSTDASHPMSHQADTPAEASGMFSSISYNKGASIIRMIKHTIGEDKFQKGLQKYLKTFSYENTVPADLLTQFDDPNIKEIAESWIEQSNYPLVTVTYDQAAKKANIKQTTFMLKKNEAQASKIWSIPLTYTFGASPDFDSTTPKEILNKASTDLAIDTEGSWLIFNIQQTGFYRVNYDTNGWTLIKEALLKDNHDNIHELNRAQIVDDLFNLARAGEISYDLAFSVLDYLKTEEHYLPWLAAFNGFSYILNKLETTQLDMFRVYLFKLLQKTSKTFSWEGIQGDTLSSLQTVNVFNWFCKLGHVYCDFESNRILAGGLTIDDISKIPLQIRESVVCSIAKNSLFTLKDLNTLWEYSAKYIWEEQSILTALGCATNQEVLTEFLDRVLDRAQVRHHFRRAAFDSTYTQSIENVQFVLDYSIRNHAKISAGFNDISAVITTISSLAARFTKLEQVVQVEDFYLDNLDEYRQYESRIEDIIENAREDFDWTSKHFGTLPIEVVTSYYRLEETTVPIRYELEITPYLEKDNEYNGEQFTFDGKVRIILLPTEDGRNTLRLNVKNLKIHSAILLDSDSTTIKTFYEIADEFMTLAFDSNLVKNKEYSLTFEYTGSMDLDMHGFYISSYVENGVTEFLGSTQLQTTHARRVFPGFDEPEYKATFSVTINKPKSYNAYSNMNPVDSTPEGIPGINTYDKVTFKPTPKMSTYLLAFTVAKFKIRQNAEKNFGVIARPDQFDQTLYALTDGITSLQKLGNYLDYSYYEDDMEKLDMVALPDFSAGAMENWGLMTYRESNLLYDADYTTQYTKQRILTVIAHEQAHLWFGDLVTCKWWEYAWLNEGFARFFEYEAAHLVQPTWDIDQQFVVEQVHTALLFDSNENIHPMSSPVNSPAETSAIFDNISYNKGGSIIRMIQHMIGQDKFEKALQSYIQNNKFGSSTPDKLFAEFFEVAKDTYQNLNDIIIPWTIQPNYPVVTVTYNSNTKQATVTQKTFLLNKSANSIKYTWSIPLTYTTRAQGFKAISKTTTILSDVDFTFNIDATDSWLIFNVQQTGFYRVNYDKDGWELIMKGLQIENHDGIHEINRAQIVDDLFNFARANEVTYELAFTMLHYLKNETHYLPWHAAFTGFALLTQKMDETQLGAFRAYLIRLLSKSYAEVDWTEAEDDVALKIYHRANVINWLCRSKSQDCITKAKQLYDEYKADATKLVPINIRGPVFCSVMRNGGLEDLDFLWTKFQQQEVATEKNIISQAIGCASNKTVLYAVIDKLLTKEIRSQDKRTMLTYTFTQTEENVQHVLDYAIENYVKIIEGFENDASAVVTTLTALVSRFTNEAQILQVENFVGEHKDEFGTFAALITNSLKDATTNLKLNEEAVKKILTQIEVNLENDVEDKPGDDGDGGAITISISFLLISLAAMFTLLYN